MAPRIAAKSRHHPHPALPHQGPVAKHRNVIPSLSRGNRGMAIKRTGQFGFVEALLSTKGGSGQLDRLDDLVKWYRFGKLIGHLRDAASPGRPGYPVMVLFKAVLLQSLYGLSERELEQALDDRLSFRRFVGLSLEEAVPEILRAVCESLAWDYGEVWELDPEANVLRLSEIWHRTRKDIDKLEATSRKMAIRPGDGLAGRVWSGRQPCWVPNVAEEGDLLRGDLVAKLGLG